MPPLLSRRASLPLLAAALLLSLQACASAPLPPPQGAPAAAGKAPDGREPLEASLALELPWERVLEGVLERSPAVAAARARWKAALERHPQEVSLPDPMVEFLYYTRHSSNPDAPRRLDTMVTQTIPFPATLSLRGDRALLEADLERLRYDAALRDAVVEAREAWLEIGYLDRARGVLEEQEGVYARFAEAAATDLAVGRAKLPEETRARALLSQAANDRLVVEDLRRVEEQRLRALLALDPSSPLGPPPAAGLLRLEATLADVLARAETRSQEIAMAGVSLEMAGIERSLARWEFAPELEVGGTWLRNMEDASGEFMGGRGVNLGLTVPLWIPAKTARIREAEAREAAAGADRAAAVEKVRAEATRLYFRQVNGARLVALYRDVLLPQAEGSLAFAESLYREGQGSLAGALEAAAARQNLLLAYHRAGADHGQAVARLEQVVGATLAAPAAEGDR